MFDLLLRRLAAAAIALSALAHGAQAQAITECTIVDPLSRNFLQYTDMAIGPDGQLWVTYSFGGDGGGVGKMALGGCNLTPIHEQAFTQSFHDLAVTAGADNNAWVGTTSGFILKISPDGSSVTQYSLPDPNGTPFDMVKGPDNNVWYSDINVFYRIGTNGSVTTYHTSGTAEALAAGPDGNVWFSKPFGKIGYVTSAGVVTEFSVANSSFTPAGRGIARGSDGALWFTEAPALGSGGSDGGIGRITTSGVATHYDTPGLSGLDSIVAGPDGALWFTVQGNSQKSNLIGRITTGGTVTSYAMPLPNSPGSNIVAGGDGKLYVLKIDTGSIAIVDPAIAAAPTSTIVSAVLPASRSVSVHNTATAFATIINTGGNTAKNCALSIANANVDSTFAYQTTDPATNRTSGTMNTAADIPPGGAQSFVFAMTPNTSFAPTDVPISAQCTNTPPAPTTPGLNTFLLSSNSSPAADIVALAATAANNGIVDIPGTNGTGAFAVATVNVGNGSIITATADTNGVTLPVNLTLCQTNQSTGQCTSPIGASAQTFVNPNDTPTFAIFVKGTGNVPFDPAHNRIFVRFTDATNGGTVRGATSVAVRTQ